MGNEGRYYGFFESPIGWIEVVGTEIEILSLKFVDEPWRDSSRCPGLETALQQVSEYFIGTRRAFDLPLALHGTPFQCQVWDQVMNIPYGQTATYQEIARAIGKPRTGRAVGAANGKNPISIIVPCHRVIGSDGSLTGYGGGIWRKEWLLNHEGVYQN